MNILEFDYYIFQLINQEWHNGFLDAIIPIWRNKLFWIPLYLFIFSFLLLNYAKKGAIVILCLAATIAVADVVSSRVIKPNIKRVRPCNNIQMQDEVRLMVRCGSGYSFTSSHATNHMAIAVFLILTIGGIFKWIRLPLIFWALSIGYGQIYVGVHYPIDILGGALVGLIIGILTAELCRYLLLEYTEGTLKEEFV